MLEDAIPESTGTLSGKKNKTRIEARASCRSIIRGSLSGRGLLMTSCIVCSGLQFLLRGHVFALDVTPERRVM